GSRRGDRRNRAANGEKFSCPSFAGRYSLFATKTERTANDEQRSAITQTAPRTLHRPGRKVEYHLRHISRSQFVPHPCRRRILKLLSRRNLRIRTHSDRPCRSLAVQSIHWLCNCGRERRRASLCHRRKCS